MGVTNLALEVQREIGLRKVLFSVQVDEADVDCRRRGRVELLPQLTSKANDDRVEREGKVV